MEARGELGNRGDAAPLLIAVVLPESEYGERSGEWT